MDRNAETGGQGDGGQGGGGHLVRQGAIAENKGSSAGRVTAGAVMLVAFAGFAVFVLDPETITSRFPQGTSESETMQERTNTGSGIDTGFSDDGSGDTGEAQPVDTGMPDGEPEAQPVDMPNPGLDFAATQDRIARLMDRVEELETDNAETTERIQALLADQAETLREQFEAERRRRQEAFQRRLAAARDAARNTGGGNRAAEERLRRQREEAEAIRREQITSEGVVIDTGGTPTTTAEGGSSQGGAGRDLTDNEEYLRSASRQSYETVKADQIPAPERTIVQGTTLRATLETAISTELPGAIRAVVSTDVYSYDGSQVLLPRGTRLIGSYNPDVSVVQGRVQIAWSRAVTPKGITVELGGYGADRLGRSGQGGFVDSRFGARFGSAALISLIGAGPKVVIAENGGGAGSDAAEDVGQDLERATGSVMSDYLSASPVIYVDQGTDMTVFVDRDLVF